MKIAAVCVTYQRAHLLPYLIHCFEQQDYEDRELLILDDAGQYGEQSGDRWRVVSVKDRFPSLGEKRNAAIAMTDAPLLAVWDDDDLYLPWSLRASVDALLCAEWSRPSEVLLARGRVYQRQYTWDRADRSDKAFHGGWAFRREAFERVGGYPVANNGEDRLLAQRFVSAGATEADPVALGYQPFYIYGPHGVRHFSADGDYAGWKGQGRETGSLAAKAPPFNVTTPTILATVARRFFRGAWM